MIFPSKENTSIMVFTSLAMLLCFTRVETAPTRCSRSPISMQGNTFEESPSAPVGVYEQSGIEASGKFGGRARKEDLESVVPFAGVLSFIEDEEIFYMTKVKMSIQIFLKK